MAKFIKPAEIMAKYGVSRKLFYKLVREGFLKRRKPGRMKRGLYLDEDVEIALKIK